MLDMPSLRPPQPRKQEPPWNLGRWANMAPFETERAMFYFLVGRLKFELNVDFLYQQRLPVKGINQTGLNRSDFWVLPRGKGATYGVGSPPYGRGRVLNPIASGRFIHTIEKDRFERSIIRQQAKIDVVYLLDWMLYAQQLPLVELALRGVDRSGR
jgi:hypothetical protein